MLCMIHDLYRRYTVQYRVLYDIYMILYHTGYSTGVLYGRTAVLVEQFSL